METLNQPAKQILLTMEQIIAIYNAGYGSGHHQTVEGFYTHVYNEDIETYQSDVVEELIEELLK